MNVSTNSARLASIEDAPSILSICLESEQHTDIKGGISLLSVIDWIDNANDQYPLWVLERNNAVIAWCSLEAFYGLPSFDGVAEVAIYITSSYQRRGIGQQLLSFIVRYCSDRDIHSLVAYILSENSKSQQFFLKNDFVEWGCLPAVARSGETYSDLKLLGRQIL